MARFLPTPNKLPVDGLAKRKPLRNASPALPEHVVNFVLLLAEERFAKLAQPVGVSPGLRSGRRKAELLRAPVRVD